MNPETKLHDNTTKAPVTQTVATMLGSCVAFAWSFTDEIPVDSAQV